MKRSGRLVFYLLLIAGLAAFVTIASQWRRPVRREHPDLPGIDVAGLNAEPLQSLLTQSKHQSCPCGCGFTLADCRHKDPTCPRSGPILDRMVKDYRESQQNPGGVE